MMDLHHPQIHSNDMVKILSLDYLSVWVAYGIILNIYCVVHSDIPQNEQKYRLFPDPAFHWLWNNLQ